MAARNGSPSAVHYAVHHRNLDLGADAGPIVLLGQRPPRREVNPFHETCDLGITQPFPGELPQAGFAIDNRHRQGKVQAESGLQAIFWILINQW